MPPEKPQKSDDYDPSKIIKLTPREHVRLRPGMYIGGVDKRALHHMLWEVLDDAMSEFGADKNGEITISLLADNSVSVSDNGQGLPTNKLVDGQYWIEAYFTKAIGFGEKGREKLIENGIGLDISRGLFGIGVAAVNALSSFCAVETLREGYLWRQSYREGIVISPVEQVRPLADGEGTGTSVTFRPDFAVMDDNEFDFALIAARCQELAYLLPNLKIIIEDKRENPKTEIYHHPLGLIEALKILSSDKSPKTDAYAINFDCPMMDNANQMYIVQVQIAFQWFDNDETLIRSYANTVETIIETIDKGYHVDALKAAIQKQSGIGWRYWNHGFIGIIQVLHPYPQFENKAQKRFTNTDAFMAVEEAIEALFAANPDVKAAIQAKFS